MSVVGNIFCPECDSVLDVSRTSTKKTYDLDATPSSVSDDGEDRIINFINKILKHEEVDDILENIKAEQITGHEYFQKLDKAKKEVVNNKIEKYMSKSASSDSSTLAYYVCKTCSWSQKIKPGTQILSKIGGNNQATYLNVDRYKNKIHSRVLPFTRNFICPNKDCPGNKDNKKHEAVIFRVNDSLRTMYACCACKTVFNAQ
jgi:hypothetical protein